LEVLYLDMFFSYPGMKFHVPIYVRVIKCK
jgi:hypothetical protein